MLKRKYMIVLNSIDQHYLILLTNHQSYWVLRSCLWSECLSCRNHESRYGCFLCELSNSLWKSASAENLPEVYNEKQHLAKLFIIFIIFIIFSTQKKKWLYENANSSRELLLNRGFLWLSQLCETSTLQDHPLPRKQVHRLSLEQTSTWVAGMKVNWDILTPCDVCYPSVSGSCTSAADAGLCWQCRRFLAEFPYKTCMLRFRISCYWL